jgi:hypothetical protein
MRTAELHRVRTNKKLLSLPIRNDEPRGWRPDDFGDRGGGAR